MGVHDRSEWQEIPREQPRLVEYDWVHERRRDKRIPPAIIDSALADLADDDRDEAPTVH